MAAIQADEMLEQSFGRPSREAGRVDGEVARLLSQCNCGYTIPCGDGERLAYVIRELADNPVMGRTLGKNGRTCLEIRLDKSHAMQRWAALLSSPETALPDAD